MEFEIWSIILGGYCVAPTITPLLSNSVGVD